MSLYSLPLTYKIIHKKRHNLKLRKLIILHNYNNTSIVTQKLVYSFPLHNFIQIISFLKIIIKILCNLLYPLQSPHKLSKLNALVFIQDKYLKININTKMLITHYYPHLIIRR